MGVMKEALRIEDRGVGNVKSGGIEFLEDNFRHPLPVGWSVPRGLRDEDWVVGRINMHNILQCMANEWSNWIKILNWVVVGTERVNVERKCVLSPSFKGFPTSIPSL